MRFSNWFSQALPAIIFQHIIVARAVKVCSNISPIFGFIARHHGYDAYVLQTPGHVVNVVVTEDGPLLIDLSAIQFKLCDFVSEEDITDWDLYGTEGALRKVLRYIIRNPWRAIKVEPYTGSMHILQEPAINSMYQDFYLESFERALETVDALRRKDPSIYEIYDDIRYLTEWESELNS